MELLFLKKKLNIFTYFFWFSAIVYLLYKINNDLNNFSLEIKIEFEQLFFVFICTFFSPYTAAEIHEKLAHRPAIMIFDITDPDTYGVNLPPKYYMGIFPEIQKTMDSIQEKWEPIKTSVKNKIKEDVTPKIEEYDSVDEILDKLSRNNYDRNCLTKKELEILNNG